MKNQKLIEVLKSCREIVATFEEPRETYTKKVYQFLLFDIDAQIERLTREDVAPPNLEGEP